MGHIVRRPFPTNGNHSTDQLRSLSPTPPNPPPLFHLPNLESTPSDSPASTNSLDESQEITVNAYDGYTAWVIRNFGSETPGVTGEGDDPDSDGIGNLCEFAFLLDPTIDDSQLMPSPAFDPNEQALTVTYSKNFLDPSEFAIVTEVTSTLGSWSSDPSDVSHGSHLGQPWHPDSPRL